MESGNDITLETTSYNLKQAAEKIGVQYETLLTWRRIGKIETFYINRMPFVSIEEINKHKIEKSPEGTKWCAKCRTNKPLAVMRKRGKCCNECHNIANRVRYSENTEHCKKVNQAWKKANRKRTSDTNHARYVNNQDELKAKSNCSKYGLSYEQYLEMLKKSGGRCAICQKLCDKLSIDHDHSREHEGASSVRDLLCNSCNSAVAFVQEDIKISQAVTDYLRKHKNISQVDPYQEFVDGDSYEEHF